MSSPNASGTFFRSQSGFSTIISASNPRNAWEKPRVVKNDLITASQSLWYSSGGEGDGLGDFCLTDTAGMEGVPVA